MTDKESNIGKHILSKPKGTLLFPHDFSHLGKPAAIRKALQRLREKELKQRINGIVWSE